MVKMRIFGVISAAILAACGGSSGPDFTASLSAPAETPPLPAGPTGTAVYTISGTTVNYTITYTGLSGPPTLAHIHLGADGVKGGIVLPFSLPAGLGASGNFSGSFTQSDISPSTTPPVSTLNDLLAQMRTGNTYTNIHTGTNRGGEIRGQNVAKK